MIKIFCKILLLVLFIIMYLLINFYYVILQISKLFVPKKTGSWQNEYNTQVPPGDKKLSY